MTSAAIVLLLAHVLLTTAGFVGLIAANVYLLYLARDGDAAIIRAGLAAWRKSSRIFGPVLALGFLLGFGVAASFQVPLASPWLLATYVLVAVALAVQAGIVVPWQLRADRILDAALPSMVPVRVVLASLCVVYAAIVTLMLARPS